MVSASTVSDPIPYWTCWSDTHPSLSAQTSTSPCCGLDHRIPRHGRPCRLARACCAVRPPRLFDRLPELTHALLLPASTSPLEKRSRRTPARTSQTRSPSSSSSSLPIPSSTARGRLATLSQARTVDSSGVDPCLTPAQKFNVDFDTVSLLVPFCSGCYSLLSVSIRDRAMPGYPLCTRP
jgi:hypothetical protein